MGLRFCSETENLSAVFGMLVTTFFNESKSLKDPKSGFQEFA